MPTSQKFVLFVLRIAIGWLFLYAGIIKVLDPSWTAAGYIADPAMFKAFYAWLGTPKILPFVDFLNQWGLTLIGAALILGAFVRTSAFLGAVLMLLYYFPLLDFPYPNAHSYIVEEHIIYAVVLILLAVFHAGRYWGLEKHFRKLRH